MKLIRFLRKVRQYFVRYDPLVVVLISKERLLGNLREYKNKYPKLKFAPVLKSNAYGHGLVLVAKILDNEGVPFLVLDSLYEAMILRNNGIKSDILIVGYTRSENIINSKLRRIAFTITSLDQLMEVSKIASSKTKIHLKVDTGMHRQGILPNQVGDAIEIIRESKFLELDGLCSHLADADNANSSFTKIQLVEWEKISYQFRKNIPTIKFFHISATAGTFYGEQSSGNVVRLGIGLYGINPSPITKINLKPVLEMRSIVSSLKKMRAGECVGYNATYKAKKDLVIATIPVGYFEGVDWNLSNAGFLKIKNSYCPIVGRVSMNITSVDVTSVPNIKIGDEVVVVSGNSNDKNSVENMAGLVGTIPWVILSRVPQHLRRIVTN